MPSEGYALNQGVVAVYATGSVNVQNVVSSSLNATGLYTAAEVNTAKVGNQLLFTLHPTKKQTSTVYYSTTSATEFFSNDSSSYTLPVADFTSSLAY